MNRLTITLEDSLHQSLKETAARQGRTIGSIIEESLKLRGIRSIASTQQILKQARNNANLSDEDAMNIALEETHQVRHQE